MRRPSAAGMPREFLGDEFGERLRSYSPILVTKIELLKTCRGELVLDFFHANYPQGVQDKSYRLQVLERQSYFLLARRVEHRPARLLLIYEATTGWLRDHSGSMQIVLV